VQTPARTVRVEVPVEVPVVRERVVVRRVPVVQTKIVYRDRPTVTPAAVEPPVQEPVKLEERVIRIASVPVTPVVRVTTEARPAALVEDQGEVVP
jgi:hypothetical protein